VDISNCATITTSSILKIASSCVELSCLCMEGVPKVCDTAIVSLAQKHSHLRELDLSGRSLGSTTSTTASSVPRIGSPGVIAIGQHCTDLRIFRCNSCSRGYDIQSECCLSLTKNYCIQDHVQCTSHPNCDDCKRSVVDLFMSVVLIERKGNFNAYCIYSTVHTVPGARYII
jgi:hypothetical protein